MQTRPILSILLMIVSVHSLAASPPPAALDALRERRYAEALRQFEAYNGPERAWNDYLRAGALIELGRPADAADVLETHLEKEASGPLGARIAFRHAEAKMRAKRFGEALPILEKHLAILTAAARREGMARRYREMADAAAFPADTTTKADFARAIGYYDQALEFAPLPAALEAALRLARARALFERNQSQDRRNALDALEQLVRRSASGAPELVPEARFRLAAALAHFGRRWEAFAQYHELFDKGGNSPYVADGVLTMLRLSGFPRPNDRESLQRGVAIADRLVARINSGRAVEQALLLKADGLAHLMHHAESAKAYEDFLKRFPESEDAAQAAFSLGELLIRRDDLDAALARFRDLLVRYPTSAQWQEAQKKIIEIEYWKVNRLFAAKNYTGAIAAGERFLKTYPLDPRNPALHRQAGLCHELAGNTNRAIESWLETARLYPRGEVSARALLDAGDRLAILGTDFPRTFECYEKAATAHPPLRAEAEARARRLRAESLVLITTKGFLASEGPKVSLALRNLPEVRLQIYHLDPESYFRSTHGLAEVEKLDVELIDPDGDFIWKKPGYARYRETRDEIPLPGVDKPGAYLVRVSSEKLQAVTLVLVSDIGLIVRASSDQALASVFDLKSGAPVAGARLLFSNGKEIFAEAASGADGIVLQDLSNRKASGPLSVLALRNGHPAAATPGWYEAAVTPGKESLSHLATDRPVYRPGDTVRFRLTLRERDPHAYLTPGGRIRLAFRLPSGQEAWSMETNLSAFGTASGLFRLDPATPQGDGTLVAISADERTLAAHALPINRFTPPATEARLVPSKPVCLPGETLTVRVTLSRLFGAAASLESFRYRINNDPWLQGKTDAAGSAEIRIQTGRYASDRAVSVQVRPEREDRLFSLRVPLAMADFSLLATTPRRVWIAGEEVPVTIRVLALPGTSAARKLTVTVLHHPTGENPREIVSTSLESDAKGEGLYRFRVEKAGRHTVQVSGSAAGGEPVIASVIIDVPDPAGEKRLFLLSDRDEHPDDAPLTLHAWSALDDGEALLTIERERIFEYRRLRIGRGFNRIRIDPKPAFYPNAVVSLSIGNRSGFHQDTLALRLRRNLSVKIEGEEKAWEPGGEVTLRFAVSDQNGAPRRGSLFIAVVDEAYRMAVPGIASNLITTAFAKPRTFRMMRGAASTPFRYAPATAERDRDLAAEEKRKEEDRRPAAESAAGGRSRTITPAQSPSRRDLFGFAGDSEDARFRSVADEEKPAEPEPVDAPPPDLGALAFYRAELISGPDGKSEARFRLPASRTRWLVLAVAADTNAAFGEGERSFRAGSERFTEIDVPALLREGDRGTVRIVFRNTGKDPVRGDAKWSIGGQNGTFTLTNLVPGGRQETSLPVTAGAAPIEVSISGPCGEARTRIPVEARSAAREDGKAGLAGASSASTVEAFLNLPSGARSPSMEIRIAPPASAVLDDDPWQPAGLLPAPPSHAALLFRDAARLEYLEALTPEDSGRRALLRASLIGALGHFRILATEKTLQAQSPDDLAFIYAALSVALRATGTKSNGLLEPLRDRLDQAFSAASDNETKILALFALSFEREASLAHLTRLFRLRDTLENRELALLAITAAQSGRQEMAGPLGDTLERRFQRDTGLAWLPGRTVRIHDWYTGTNDHTALGLAALVAAKPASPVAAEAFAWLATHREPAAWRSPVEAGFRPWALSRFLLTGRDEGRYQVRIEVNGRSLESLSGPAARGIRVPAEALREGRNTVRLTGEGRGRFWYRIRLTWQDSAGHPAAERHQLGTLRLSYGYPDLLLDGKPVRAGYSQVQGDYRPVTNELSTIAAGEAFPVTLAFTPADTPARTWIISVPLPPGTRLLTPSISGATHYLEQSAGMARFWVRAVARRRLTLSFQLLAESPGRVTIPGASAAPLFEPWSALRTAPRSLAILEKAAPYRSGYRSSPDELLALAAHHLGRKQYTRAAGFFNEALANWPLTTAAQRRALDGMLRCALASGKEREIVRWFEQLKERFPQASIAFTDAEKIATAYRKIGEHERSCQMLTGILDGLFLRESALSTALTESLRLKDSIEWAMNLLDAYPDNAEQRLVRYSLAQQLLDRADNEDATALRRLGTDKTFLVDKALEILDGFLLQSPGAESAPEAAFTIASRLVQLERHTDAKKRVTASLAAYKDLDLHDAFLYLDAHVRFLSRDSDGALASCARVAETRFRRRDGTSGPSRYRNHALHMRARILHALGRYREAIVEYEKVASEFRDAAQAIRELGKRMIDAPEVTRFTSDETARIRIRYQGIDSLTMTVYRVDFLNLSLKYKDLSRITAVNLSGIRPWHVSSIKLSATAPLLSEETELTVPPGEKGAYLVVLKANGAEASCMVIRSDLVMDVLEPPGEGTARITLRDRKNNLVAGAQVRFISGSGEVSSAKTDLRGSATADGLSGRATIVAVHEGRYAFHRGVVELTPGASRQPRGGIDEAPDGLHDLMEQQKEIQRSNRGVWDEKTRQRGKDEGLRLDNLW